ncbi:hypothetical protein [Propionibacterium freudenreichii]|uniref:hypothetical protein n=1 Tax=Propionibacterium freudenreichii TaxID=1744 RepID=UPI001E629872|nr:hypothetical protein [Propionibacterium freudenreichii]
MTLPDATPVRRTRHGASGGPPRPGPVPDRKLLDPKLLVGIVVVAGLLVLSLTTGVYDVFGASDGSGCSRSPACRAPSRWSSPVPRWP